MKKSITDTLADRARPPKGKRQDIIRDTQLKGFLLRVGQTGNAFAVEKKIDGKTIRTTIGDAAVWSAEDARSRAREMLKEIDQRGEVVTATKRLADVWEHYRQHELPLLSASAQRDRRRHWEVRIEPVMGSKRLNAITRADATALHRSIEAPFEGNRVIESLRRLFNYAIIDLEWHDGRNPAQAIKRNDEPSRKAFFSPTEIASIMEHLPLGASGDLIRILVLTGCRPKEAKQMTWSQIDLDRRVWTKPAAMTKQNMDHHAPLNDGALEVISRQPRRGPLVFTRTRGGPVKDVKKCWQNALKAAGVPYRCLYTCRHSMASLLASSGISLQVVGAVLGHNRAETTMKYSHLYDTVIRDAVNVVRFPSKKAG